MGDVTGEEGPVDDPLGTLVQSALREQGMCGSLGNGNACVMPTGHEGSCGWEVNSDEPSGEVALLQQALPWLEYAYDPTRGTGRPGTSDDLRVLVGKIHRAVQGGPAGGSDGR